MEAKKNREANIERLRVPITLIGLLFTGSIVLASFSFTTGLERDLQAKNDANAAEINFLEEIVKPDELPEPVRMQDPISPPDVNIIIDSNTTTIPDPNIILPPPDIEIGKKNVVIVDPPIIDFPDVEASFPGGTVEMQKWIANHVQYPQTSVELNEQERVYLSYVVEIDGTITNISVSRGEYKDLVREAKRLIRSMPHWIPGEAAGKKVRTRCMLPINFTLN